MVLDFVCVNVVVLSVSSNKSDPGQLIAKIEFYNQTVIIPFYIEYKPVFTKNTDAWISVFYFINTFPMMNFSIAMPCFKRLHTIRMLSPKLLQSTFRKNPHLQSKDTHKFPFWEVIFAQ